LEALSHKKMPQKDAMAADRAFLPGALSVKTTLTKARGCGHFSVRNRIEKAGERVPAPERMV